MTGFRHKSFRHNCGTSENCYIQQLPSWDFLDGVFPRGIIPTDIDGMVEVNGHILFLEEKRAGASPSGGQLSAFRQLSRLDNVKVVLTRPGQVSEMQMLVLDGGDGSGWMDVSRDDYASFLRAWSDYADSTRAKRNPLLDENRRLRCDNEMLRRQVNALIEGPAA